MSPQSIVCLLHVALLVGLLHAAPSDASAQPPSVDREPAKRATPDRRSTRGDYDIEHYRLKKDDLIKIKTRGTYKVVGVEEGTLMLKPLPGQRGLLPGVWRIREGRTPMGNHHKMVVSRTCEKTQSAKVALEYKERWHWWDVNF